MNRVHQNKKVFRYETELTVQVTSEHFITLAI